MSAAKPCDGAWGVDEFDEAIWLCTLDAGHDGMHHAGGTGNASRFPVEWSDADPRSWHTSAVAS